MINSLPLKDYVTSLENLRDCVSFGHFFSRSRNVQDLRVNCRKVFNASIEFIGEEHLIRKVEITILLRKLFFSTLRNPPLAKWPGKVMISTWTTITSCCRSIMSHCFLLFVAEMEAEAYLVVSSPSTAYLLIKFSLRMKNKCNLLSKRIICHT